MWVTIGIVVGLVTAGILTALLVRRRRAHPDQVLDMSADELLTLGVVFAGAGVALFATIGVAGIGLLAVGLVFMGMGIQRKRA